MGLSFEQLIGRLADVVNEEKVILERCNIRVAVIRSVFNEGGGYCVQISLINPECHLMYIKSDGYCKKDSIVYSLEYSEQDIFESKIYEWVPDLLKATKTREELEIEAAKKKSDDARIALKDVVNCMRETDDFDEKSVDESLIAKVLKR